MFGSVKPRLIAFAFAIVLVGGGIGWAAHRALTEVSRLHAELSRQTIESYNTADLFRADLSALQYALLRLRHQPDAREWEQFMQHSKRLNDWIDLQIPKLRSQEEKQILDAMTASYDVFVSAALHLSTNNLAAQAPEGFAAVEHEADRLLQLNAQLLEAHRRSLTSFVDRSQSSLRTFRFQVVGALVLLLALAVLLAV